MLSVLPSASFLVLLPTCSEAQHPTHHLPRCVSLSACWMTPGTETGWGGVDLTAGGTWEDLGPELISSRGGIQDRKPGGSGRNLKALY